MNEEIIDRLAQADFSKESRIRESLRARLVEKTRPGWHERSLRALMLSVPRPALAVALLILVAMLPLTRGFKDFIETPPLRPPEIPRAQATTEMGFSHDRLGLPILPGYFPMPNPQKVEDSPIGTVEGRPIPTKNGSAILWKTEGADYILERRQITPDEIFEMHTVL